MERNRQNVRKTYFTLQIKLSCYNTKNIISVSDMNSGKEDQNLTLFYTSHNYASQN